MDGLERIKWALDPQSPNELFLGDRKLVRDWAMNIYLDVQSPAGEAGGAMASLYGLEHHGLTNLRRVYWNLPAAALYEEAIHRSEGQMAAEGPLIVDTGKHTARAAADKFVVREPSTEEAVWWGQYNRPFNPESFSALSRPALRLLQGRDVFVQDVYGGPIPSTASRPDRHAEGLAQPLRPHDVPEEHDDRGGAAPRPGVHDHRGPGLPGEPMADGTRTETFIVLNFRQKLAVIGASGYPARSRSRSSPSSTTCCPRGRPLDALLGERGPGRRRGDLFGLSGTGKTTLSADPARRLVGDDEHGWGRTASSTSRTAATPR